MIKCIVLCASHIDSLQRYVLLMNSLSSIFEQYHKVEIYLSVYSSFDLWFPTNNLLHVFRQDKKTSQFNHFYFLSKQFSNDQLEQIFFIFMDDDDFSHPIRTLFYSSAEDKGQNSLLATNSLLLLEDSPDNCYHSVERCDKLLKQQHAKLLNGHEYFMYAVRGKVLHNFCKILDLYEVLNLKVCDVLFGSVLHNSTKLSRDANRWIYAYMTINKDRDREYETYTEMIKNERLLSSLRKEFNLTTDWNGQTSLY